MIEFPINFKLLCSFYAGSHMYGTNTPASDIDVRGVLIASEDYYLGFKNIEQLEGNKEEDLVYHELRKFFKLALICNPTVIEYLFVTNYINKTELWDKIIENRNLFLSKKARYTFAGYAFSQLKRIRRHRAWLLNPPKKQPLREDFGLPNKSLINADQLGAFNCLVARYLENIEQYHPLKAQLLEMHETADYLGMVQSLDAPATIYKGLVETSDNFLYALQQEKEYNRALKEWHSYLEWQQNRNPARAELEKKYGLDCKHASHLVRLMLEGEELLLTGNITLPLKKEHKDLVLGIKNGCFSYDQLEVFANDFDAKFQKLYESSSLPKKPDLEGVEKLCLDILKKNFKG